MIAHWDRFVSTVGLGRCHSSRWLVQPFAVGKAINLTAAGRPSQEIESTIPLVGVLGLLILYGGYHLAEMDIHPETYPRVLVWALGKFGLLFGVDVLRERSPDVTIDEPLKSAALATTIGAVAGLIISLHEA